MILEDRSEFWREVADHPEVKPHVGLGHSLDIMALVANPLVLPLRSENGGFLFVRLDGLGRVYELHTLYRPGGWGREVLAAGKEALGVVFGQGGQIVVTSEVLGWWRSQPPRTFRFQPVGDFAPALGNEIRTWVLTRPAWESSPAFRSME